MPPVVINGVHAPVPAPVRMPPPTDVRPNAMANAANALFGLSFWRERIVTSAVGSRRETGDEKTRTRRESAMCESECIDE